jgi:hypothetical protein
VNEHWAVRHFVQPIPYVDEPTECIPAGVYVVSHAGHIEDAKVVFEVITSFNELGRDNRLQIASRIVDILNTAPSPIV